MSDFQVFLPIAKVDKESRTVSGYASTPTKDGDGEIVTLDAIRDALPDYMVWGNIREMHALKAVGVAEEANMDMKGLFLTAKIVDDAAWKKCLEGVYKGFSIGGRKTAKSGNKITGIEMTEISVVDRPSNPDCSISLAKSAKSLGDDQGYLIKVKNKRSAEAKALGKMAKIVGDLAKANPPAAKDGLSLPAVMKADEIACAPHGKIGCEKCAAEKAAGNTPCDAHGKMNCEECKAAKKAEGSDKPYGDVEYADPGYQEDKKKRYPVDTEEHIRAAWNYINKSKNAAKYGENASKVKAKIVSAWKSKIDKDGPPSAEAKPSKEAKKLRKAILMQGLELKSVAPFLAEPSFLTLRKSKEAAPVIETIKKSMSTAGSLAYCFDSIRSAQRSLLMEAKREGGDMKDKALAEKLGSMAKDLADVISQKASHEGEEALDLSDADDQYVSTLFIEEDNKMAAIHNGSGDPIADAVATLMKRAAMPTRMQRMAMAEDNAKKSRKAIKAAGKSIEEAHKMCKAAYMAKAAKGKDDKKDDDFDHAGMMEKLQKAYGEIATAKTMNKAASAQIAKAMGRSGQQGQEAGDAEAGFFEVPAGVTDLTPAAMAGAAPGTKDMGSQPPAYPDDGSVYAGKAAGAYDLRKYAKNGMISADVAELIMKGARAEGELEALRSLPAQALGGRRPHAFDTTKVFGGSNGSYDPRELNKALFEGVDTNALNSTDEHARNSASATVMGNFLLSGHFGKSVFDPAFRGAAGSSR